MLKALYKAKELENHAIQAHYSKLRNELFVKLKDEISAIDKKYPELQKAAIKATSKAGFDFQICFTESNILGITVFGLDDLDDVAEFKHFTWEELE